MVPIGAMVFLSQRVADVYYSPACSKFGDGESLTMATPDEILENTVRRCRERNIIVPPYREMADPTLVPDGIREELGDVGLWDLHSRNLFRISWKNEPVDRAEDSAR